MVNRHHYIYKLPLPPFFHIAVLFRRSSSEKAIDNTKDWLSFMLLYNWVIPISLYVTMELQKMAGFLLIRWDIDMYDPIHDEPALARTSGKFLFTVIFDIDILFKLNPNTCANFRTEVSPSVLFM